MSQAEAGKGSRPRPYSVSQEEYASRWDAIFGRDGLDDNQEKLVDNNQQSNYNNTETKKD